MSEEKGTIRVYELMATQDLVDNEDPIREILFKK